jgi:hypothetical protein
MALTKPKLSQNIDTDISVFSDPILVLHQGSTTPDVDVGFLMNRSNGLTANAAVIWQESSKSFVHILTNSSGVANSNLAVQSYANVSVGNVLLINNAGIYVDGTLGSAGQILQSDGSKTYWGAPGGFTGGTVPDVTIFQSNLVVSNTTPSTSTNTGALVVRGGAGIAGNVYADALRTTTGIYWSGNGEAFTSTTIANTAEITANLSSGQNVGLSLTATGVAAGNYGSATSIPTIVVDDKGRITSVTSNAVSTTITLAGGSGSGSVAGGGTLTVAGTTNQITTSVSSSTITIALAQDITAPGNLTVTGNLVVQGNTTTLNTETLTIEDLNITVANGAINAAAADGAGLTVGGANARLLYKSATDSWVFDRGVFASGNLVANSGTTSSSVSTGALVVAGGAGINGALHIQNTGDVSANIGTLFTGNTVTNANLGAFQTFSNANAATQATSINTINANIGAFYTYANTKIGTNANSNLVVTATTTSTSTTTGALVVAGGVGIAGNLNVGSGTSGYKATFASPGAGTSGVMFIGAALNSSGNGLVISSTTRTTADNTVPLLHIIARDGGVALSTTVQGNTVIGSTTTSTSTTTGALVVRGGTGVAGNVYTDRLYTTTGLFWAGNGAAFSGGATLGFPNSTVAIYPTGDYGDFTSTKDAFGVHIDTVYDCMEPIGSITTVDLNA